MVPPLRIVFKSHHVVLPYPLPSTMGRAPGPERCYPSQPGSPGEEDAWS